MVKCVDRSIRKFVLAESRSLANRERKRERGRERSFFFAYFQNCAGKDNCTKNDAYTPKLFYLYAKKKMSPQRPHSAGSIMNNYDEIAFSNYMRNMRLACFRLT